MPATAFNEPLFRAIFYCGECLGREDEFEKTMFRRHLSSLIGIPSSTAAQLL
jgi:hypothetical protein